MILTCPSCSATYMVPPEAIGEKGRDVRCKKCQHTWFQKSEEGERLDDLITRIQSEDIDEDDISFREAMASSAKSRGKNKDGTGAFARIKAIFSKSENEYNSTNKPPFLKYIASCMAACATMSLFVFAFVALRWSIVGYVPALEPVYTQFGFAVSPYADVNPEESLVVEKIEIIGDGDQKRIRGNIINLTSDEIRLPRIRVSYKVADGSIVKEDQYRLSQASIGKETSAILSLPMSGKYPEDVSLLEISFIE